MSLPTCPSTRAEEFRRFSTLIDYAVHDNVTVHTADEILDTLAHYWQRIKDSHC